MYIFEIVTDFLIKGKGRVNKDTKKKKIFTFYHNIILGAPQHGGPPSTNLTP